MTATFTGVTAPRTRGRGRLVDGTNLQHARLILCSFGVDSRHHDWIVSTVDIMTRIPDCCPARATCFIGLVMKLA